MNVESGKLKPGQARCPAITTQEIIAKDKVGAPGWVRSESYEFLGDEDIPTDRYTDPAFAELEYERLWTRTWQFACREEHIPEVGDYYVYDIGTYSFIVTRVAENDIRAYFNACLHRGTKLRASGSEGSASEFKCVFHGWSWNIDGSNKGIVCPWDFPHVDRSTLNLPQARVETLGGFVWINMDQDAPTLSEYLGPEALAHFAAWKLEDRYVSSHVVKSYPANWKLSVGAFHEAYHVPRTHPQVCPANGDLNTQYDVYSDHVDRFIAPQGVPSPYHEGRYSEQEVLDQCTMGDSSMVGDDRPIVPEGGTARQVMADMYREMFEAATNTDLSGVSDSEMIDCFSYTIFPNTFLFPGISLPMAYRFLPNPKDHRETQFEIFFLRPVPKDGVRPEPAEPEYLTPEQSFTEAKSMDPGFGKIMDQDTDNLFMQQEGLEASAKPGLTLGNYQEIRIRNFEKTVDRYMTVKP
ncbi:MAG: aromatic ring-hydroxylating dioxygenase subunit alpha [Novosphingobium sp.]|nr:aromatic ring-hydroxylating dioxygenase subunit alpha [Novosphingobium sp.]